MKNTTPYSNYSTENLAKQVNEITEAIKTINSIPGDHLDFLEACRIEKMLIELKGCVIREIENRRA
jgi:hypothetical protein